MSEKEAGIEVEGTVREELAGGADTFPAIKRTLQTAGRTVLYSSLTVAGARGRCPRSSSNRLASTCWRRSASRP